MLTAPPSISEHIDNLSFCINRNPCFHFQIKRLKDPPFAAQSITGASLCTLRVASLSTSLPLPPLSTHRSQTRTRNLREFSRIGIAEPEADRSRQRSRVLNALAEPHLSLPLSQPVLKAPLLPVQNENSKNDQVQQNAVSDRLRSHAYFPLTKVVNADAIKTALLLGAIDTNMGGIAISGRRGTCKSVLARSIRALLPPIEGVSASFCNADPNNPGEWEDGLAEKLSREFPDGNIPNRIRDAPFIQIPLGVTEDRLVGTVDVEASMKAGRPIFQPGLLAEAHRGVLYVDEINLLDDGIVNLLLTILSDGWNVVEREGISISHPCRPLLIATYNPDEGELRPHLLDRIAVLLSADFPYTVEQRVAVVEAAEQFQDAAGVVLEETEALTEHLRATIVIGRELLPGIVITPRQVAYLVKEAAHGGVMGHRAEMFACRVAKASAALECRETVAPSDLQKAVELVIVPRAATIEQPSPPMQLQPPPPQPQRPEKEEENNENEEQQEENQQEVLSEIPDQFIFEAESVALDPSLLRFAPTLGVRKGSGGRSKQKKIYSEDRGRYVKAMFPKGGKVRRLAVDATLRAAAPHQLSRRRRLAKVNATGQQQRSAKPGRRVFIEKDDLRSKKLARKAGRLVIFVVDASGSMALNRMSAAKGAAIQLLAESYTCRDYVALVPFYGDQAEVLLPPSRSTALAKRRLETMPCGGRTPLAHALSTAVRLGAKSQSTSDVGRVVAVLITDGRANVSLARSNGEPAAIDPEAPAPTWEFLKEEVLDVARKLGAAKMQLLVVDTESRFLSTGFAQEIATAARGKYFHVPEKSLTSAAVAAVASSAMAEANFV